MSPSSLTKPSPSEDMLSRLPPELLIIVCSHLPSRHDLSSLRRVNHWVQHNMAGLYFGTLDITLPVASRDHADRVEDGRAIKKQKCCARARVRAAPQYQTDHRCLTLAFSRNQYLDEDSCCIDKQRYQRLKTALGEANLAAVLNLTLRAASVNIEWQTIFCQECDVLVNGTLSDMETMMQAMRGADLRSFRSVYLLFACANRVWLLTGLAAGHPKQTSTSKSLRYFATSSNTFALWISTERWSTSHELPQTKPPSPADLYKAQSITLREGLRNLDCLSLTIGLVGRGLTGLMERKILQEARNLQAYTLAGQTAATQLPKDFNLPDTTTRGSGISATESTSESRQESAAGKEGYHLPWSTSITTLALKHLSLSSNSVQKRVDCCHLTSLELIECSSVSVVLQAIVDQGSPVNLKKLTIMKPRRYSCRGNDATEQGHLIYKPASLDRAIDGFLMTFSGLISLTIHRDDTESGIVPPIRDLLEPREPDEAALQRHQSTLEHTDIRVGAPWSYWLQLSSIFDSHH